MFACETFIHFACQLSHVVILMMSTQRLNSMHFIRSENIIFGKAIENGPFIDGVHWFAYYNW
jgi:hypothetical protein